MWSGPGTLTTLTQAADRLLISRCHSGGGSRAGVHRDIKYLCIENIAIETGHHEQRT